MDQLSRFDVRTILRQRLRYYAPPSFFLPFVLRAEAAIHLPSRSPAFDPFLLFVPKLPVEISFLNYSAVSNRSFESSFPSTYISCKFRAEDVIRGNAILENCNFHFRVQVQVEEITKGITRTAKLLKIDDFKERSCSSRWDEVISL